MTSFAALAFATALALASSGWAKSQSYEYSGSPCLTPKAYILGPENGYTLPVALASDSPVFPLNMVQKLGEGYASFEYTIEADGTTSNVILTGAAGATAMIDSATDWMKKRRYTPASFRGKPIAFYGNRHQAAFVANIDRPRVAAHRWVEQNYNEAIALIQANKIDDAITLLEGTLVRGEARQRMTLFEQSTLSLALAWAHLRKDRPGEALQFAQRATFSSGQYLETEVRPAAWRLRIFLELMDGNLAFLNCASPVEAMVPTPLKFVADEAFKALATQTRRAIDGPEPLTVQGTLRANPVRGPDAEWVHPMVRRKFAFDNLGPGVKSFALTCQTQIVTGEVNSTQEWAIPNSAGSCSIRVTGEAGSRFQFVEAW